MEIFSYEQPGNRIKYLFVSSSRQLVTLSRMHSPGEDLIKILVLSFLARFLLGFLIKNLKEPYKILSQCSYKVL